MVHPLFDGLYHPVAGIQGAGSDIIEFVNECIEQSIDSDYISQKSVRRAEREYSRKRLTALIDEWKSAFPSLATIFQRLTERGASFNASEDFWKHEFLEELALTLEDKGLWKHDPVVQARDEWLSSEGELAQRRFAQEVIALLYRIGALGLKMHPDEPYWFSQNETSILASDVIQEGTKARIHPMLILALNMGRRSARRH